MASVTLHWIDPESGARKALGQEINLADFGADFYSASAGFRLAATVGGFAEILRQSPYVSGYTLSDVERQAQDLARSFPGRDDVSEFAQLTTMAARLAPGAGGGGGDSW